MMCVSDQCGIESSEGTNGHITKVRMTFLLRQNLENNCKSSSQGNVTLVVLWSMLKQGSVEVSSAERLALIADSIKSRHIHT